MGKQEDAKVELGRKCCDNCTRGGVAKDCERYEGLDADGRYDFAADTVHLMQAIELWALGDRLIRHPLYGKGKAKDETWWKCLGGLLEREGYLCKVKIPNIINKFATIYKVQLTPVGRRWLNSGGPDRKLLLKPTAEMFKMMTVIKPATLYDPTEPQSSGLRGQLPLQLKGAGLQDLTQELVKCLLKKRSELATTFECMPYMIASNAALHQMATRRPLNLKEMKDAQLDGFSDAKLQKFGREFLICIQRMLNFLPQPSNESNNAANSTKSQPTLPSQPTDSQPKDAIATVDSFFDEDDEDVFDFDELDRLEASFLNEKDIPTPPSSPSLLGTSHDSRSTIDAGSQSNDFQEESNRVQDAARPDEKSANTQDNPPSTVLSTLPIYSVTNIGREFKPQNPPQPSLSATPTAEPHKKGTFVMKTPIRGRTVNLKRILYEDDESENDDEAENELFSIRLPKRKA
ncbi:hypothetical protein ZHAS_00009762 [Anopheles sinensis]|uniref:HRDC domain-containing protein n=1 Tax=Anopheles sinensis TaxID=74873 RepID=A0A084VVV8_ANOSI|nr:hypothetical protein ZHAS_00009762 [Anopheles sinensis]